MENAKKLRLVIIVLGVLLVGFSVGAVEYTSQTGFCNSCHEMNTAFTGWDNGIHQTQHCYGCHTDEGLINKAKTKANGLREVFIHFTEEVDMEKVQSDVPPERCAKCHDMTDKKKHGERIVNFHKQHQELNFNCLTCHKGVGHTKESFTGFKNEACKQCHLPKTKVN